MSLEQEFLGADQADMLVQHQEKKFREWWKKDGYKIADENTAFDIFIAGCEIGGQTHRLVDHYHYYLDLARSEMSEATTRLAQAQKFLRDAGLMTELQITQDIINDLRSQLDRLALVPPNKANQGRRAKTRPS